MLLVTIVNSADTNGSFNYLTAQSSHFIYCYKLLKCKTRATIKISHGSVSDALKCIVLSNGQWKIQRCRFCYHQWQKGVKSLRLRKVALTPFLHFCSEKTKGITIRSKKKCPSDRCFLSPTVAPWPQRSNLLYYLLCFSCQQLHCNCCTVHTIAALLHNCTVVLFALWTPDKRWA